MIERLAIDALMGPRRGASPGASDDSFHIVVCDGPGCHAAGSEDVVEALLGAVERLGAGEAVSVRRSGCLGLCECGPAVLLLPERVFYARVAPSDADDIVRRLAQGRAPVERLLYVDPATDRSIAKLDDIPFYHHQKRRLLEAHIHSRPDEIDDYLQAGGYVALGRVLSEMAPEDVIDLVKRSGLRGRGGAGFPTGLKWDLCRKADGNGKCIICNADEGDPGAYMDRALLEGNPHAVLEGMLIGAYAIGAARGIIYCRAEYPIALRRAQGAIRQARERGLIGEDVLGMAFDFDLTVQAGAGAFVCGEETSLIASLEDWAGEPRPRPPFPAESGLLGKPTNINNVETWVNVPLIVRHGAEEYTSFGTEGSKGTKIFSLVGKARNTGLVEVPMGMSLRQLVFDIGGGAGPGRRIKAVQTGGPSGGCIPARLLDLAVDYESLAEAGSIMGSGGLIVMDDRTCMVDLGKYFLGFLKEESCGKCLPCRDGIPRMLEILTRISEGDGRDGDLDLLEELGRTIKCMSLCGLGQTAANSVLSGLRYFREEYEEHIRHKRCPAAVCARIISSPCQHTCPLEADVPAYVTLIAKGRPLEAAEVIARTNPLPNVCARVCHHPCESACTCGEAGEPIAVRPLKRFAMDRAIEAGQWPPDEQPLASREERVAIVGSGPAGLAAAFFLARDGFRVTVFEAGEAIGGALATAIPEYRLPHEVLALDVARIANMGVRFVTNTPVGIDPSLDSLRAEHDAVFIAVGAPRSLKLGVPGEGGEGVVDPITFLAQAKCGEARKPGDRVVVVGGGNVAVDAARTALRLGAAHVRIVYRRTRDEMPADPAEIEAALDEGIELDLLATPVAIATDGGRVQGVTCVRLQPGDMDASGRRKPVPVGADDFTIDADAVISAVGQAPVVDWLDDGEMISDRGLIVVDGGTYVTRRPATFAGGDAVTGAATVTQAMAAGKWTAQSISQLLSGQTPARQYAVSRPAVDVEPVTFSDDELDELLEQRRPHTPELPVEDRVTGFEEVERCLTEQDAVREARRCLRCDRAAAEGPNDHA